MPARALLSHRSFVTVRGPDRVSFLQGLVSNDVGRVAAGAAIWAALLTPQGRFLHEFFAFACPDADGEDAIWLECEQLRRDDLVQRLARYRLRARVSVTADDSLVAGVIWNEEVTAPAGSLTQADGGVIYVDPRLAAAGRRFALPADAVDTALSDIPRGWPQDYDAFRISLGLPDGSRDLEVEKALLLEGGFEELNGVDYNKGCYIGQELTARTHYRALIKRRLMPVAVVGVAPQPGTPLKAGATEAGEMRSAAGDRGLALVRLDAWRAAPSGILTTDSGARLTPQVPAWMKLPEDDKAAPS
jgi:folate-binding protein YgfZ